MIENRTSPSEWTVLKTYRIPALLFAITGASLYAGLAGDGLWDWAATVGLALPVAIIARRGLTALRYRQAQTKATTDT